MTEFWKVTLMGVPETIRIFEFIMMLVTSESYFKVFYTFSCNSKHLKLIETKNMFKIKILGSFSELNI